MANDASLTELLALLEEHANKTASQTPASDAPSAGNNGVAAGSLNSQLLSASLQQGQGLQRAAVPGSSDSAALSVSHGPNVPVLNQRVQQVAPYHNVIPQPVNYQAVAVPNPYPYAAPSIAHPVQAPSQNVPQPNSEHVSLPTQVNVSSAPQQIPPNQTDLKRLERAKAQHRRRAEKARNNALRLASMPVTSLNTSLPYMHASSSQAIPMTAARPANVQTQPGVPQVSTASQSLLRPQSYSQQEAQVQRPSARQAQQVIAQANNHVHQGIQRQHVPATVTSQALPHMENISHPDVQAQRASMTAASQALVHAGNPGQQASSSQAIPRAVNHAQQLIQAHVRNHAQQAIQRHVKSHAQRFAQVQQPSAGANEQNLHHARSKTQQPNQVPDGQSSSAEKSSREFMVAGMYCKYAVRVMRSLTNNNPLQREIQGRFHSQMEVEWNKWKGGQLTRLELLHAIAEHFHSSCPAATGMDIIGNFRTWYQGVCQSNDRGLDLSQAEAQTATQPQTLAQNLVDPRGGHQQQAQTVSHHQTAAQNPIDPRVLPVSQNLGNVMGLPNHTERRYDTKSSTMNPVVGQRGLYGNGITGIEAIPDSSTGELPRQVLRGSDQEIASSHQLSNTAGGIISQPASLTTSLQTSGTAPKSATHASVKNAATRVERSKATGPRNSKKGKGRQSETKRNRSAVTKGRGSRKGVKSTAKVTEKASDKLASGKVPPLNPGQVMQKQPIAEQHAGQKRPSPSGQPSQAGSAEKKQKVAVNTSIPKYADLEQMLARAENTIKERRESTITPAPKASNPTARRTSKPNASKSSKPTKNMSQRTSRNMSEFNICEDVVDLDFEEENLDTEEVQHDGDAVGTKRGVNSFLGESRLREKIASLTNSFELDDGVTDDAVELIALAVTERLKRVMEDLKTVKGIRKETEKAKWKTVNTGPDVYANLVRAREHEERVAKAAAENRKSQREREEREERKKAAGNKKAKNVEELQRQLQQEKKQREMANHHSTLNALIRNVVKRKKTSTSVRLPPLGQPGVLPPIPMLGSVNSSAKAKATDTTQENQSNGNRNVETTDPITLQDCLYLWDNSKRTFRSALTFKWRARAGAPAPPRR